MITVKVEIKISDDIKIELDSRSIIDIDLQLYDREDNSNPSFGIRSNSGNLVFTDYNQTVLEYANKGMLSGYKPITITLYNTLNNSCKSEYGFFAYDWDYDNDSREVTVTYGDKLQDMQNINIVGVNWIVNGTMKDLYKAIFNNTQSASFGFETFEDLDEETQHFLENTKCEYLYLEKSSLWDAWNKLATVCMSIIYYDGYYTIFKHIGGTR